jgi:hypothetical protein
VTAISCAAGGLVTALLLGAVGRIIQLLEVPPGYGSSRHPFAGRALQGGGGWTRWWRWAWARRSAPITLA